MRAQGAGSPPDDALPPAALRPRLREMVRDLLPRGQSLPDAEWERRHTFLTGLLIASAAGLVVFSVARGYPVEHVLLHELALLPLIAVGLSTRLGRRVRASSVSLGLMVASALLVHAWNGAIEAHFAFFVAIIALTLYEDWVPFTIATGFVLLHHGILGTLDRAEVYEHAGDPWLYAGIHGAFVLAAGLLAVYAWRLNEDVRDKADREEENARSSQELYRGLTDNAPDALVVVDSDGVIVLVNTQTERLFQYGRDELLGQRIEMLIPERLRSVHPAHRDDYATAPRIRQMGGANGMTARRKDGSEVSVEISLSPVETPEGRLVSAAVRDVTEHRKFTEALAEARDKALEGSRMKSQFVANISHEIRTPLNGVLGITELLKGTDLDAEQREFVETVQSSGEALLAVINDVLDVSKMEAGRLDLMRARFSPTEVVNEAAALFGGLSRQKGLQLRVTIEDGLPHAVLGDASRLRQILANLIGNAVKFTPRGLIEVHIGPGTAEGSIRFAVSDAGIGIAPEDVDAIFERFSQADNSTTRRFGGTGLGLSISRQLVRMMGGELDVKSVLGAGSSFWFEILLPVAPDLGDGRDSADRPVPPDNAEFGPLPGHSADAPILVAEDNPVNQLVAARMVEKCGFRVEIAENGKEAAALIREHQYSAVLMDCQMPVLDGYEATAQIRADEGPARHLPVIAMTAHSLNGDREKCLAAGMDDYLAKPLSVSELRETLERWTLPVAGNVGPARKADAPTRR